MYLQHFGLAEQPFQLTPDARFWFESRTHKKAMAYLGYGLAQAEGFIVITGEIGAGKSTLAQHLLGTIDPARLHAISLVSTQVEGDDMLRLAAAGLGIDTRAMDKARLLDAVEARLQEERRAGRMTLLVVDEAQNLPVSALEELRMLSNFTSGGRALLQILLLGQPEFREKLASPGLEQLRQRVIATHHLEPMGVDEVAAYVSHRLAVAGAAEAPVFADDAFAAMHHHSGGIPRRLNLLATRLLLFASLEGRGVIDGDAVAAVAEDMVEDGLQRSQPEPVLPIRPARPRLVETEPAPEPQHSAPVALPDPALLQRIAQLETQLKDQEATLRRVLVMLVDWVEGESTGHRSNAA